MKLLSAVPLMLLFAEGVLGGRSPVSRVNYGVVFEPYHTVQAVEDYWTHTIQIPMPNPVWRNVDVSICHKDEDSAFCRNVAAVQTEVNRLQSRTRQRLDETYQHILDVFPQQPLFKIRNRAIGTFQMSSDVTVQKAGSATKKDFDNLKKHIERLQKSNKEVKEFHAHNSFSSIDKHDDVKIQKLVKSIEQNHDDLSKYQSYQDSTFTHFAQLTSVLLDIQEKLHTLEDRVNRFFDNLSTLKFGKLSPGVVSPDILRQVMVKVQEHLNESYPSFQLAFTEPDYYYVHPDIFHMRHNRDIYITMRFPITNQRSLLDVYEVTTFPVPIGGAVSHSTQLLDIPRYIAMSEDDLYYAEIDSADMAKCRGHRIMHCPFPIPLVSMSDQSCSLSLFNNDPVAIEEKCDFRFLQDMIDPAIRELSSTEVLVIHGAGMSVTCADTQYTQPDCPFCVVQVPCKCSLRTDIFYVPPRITECFNGSEPSILHGTNLAVLQTMEPNHRYRRNIKGDTLFSRQNRMALDSLSLPDRSYGPVLADDRKPDLSLKAVLMAAKENRPVMTSLAESLTSGHVAVSLPLWSRAGLWDILNTIIAICGLTIAIMLYRKFKELTDVLQGNAKSSIAQKYKGHML